MQVSSNLMRFSLALYLATGCVSAAPPEHKGDFIPANLKMACGDIGSCATLAAQYYQHLGAVPGSFRGTFNDWVAHHEFGKPAPTGGTSTEAHASYYNRGDLGIGRDMHCRTYSKPTPPPIFSFFTLACYVSNYGDGTHTFSQSDPGLAVKKATAGINDGHDPFATVAMEVDWVDGLQGFGSQEVRFLAYDVHGTPQLTVKLDISKGNTNSQAVPGTCMVCHGGHGADGLNTKVSPSPDGKVLALEGKFLPFDTAQFLYGDGTRSVPNAAEHEQFRQLNAQIRGLYATWSVHPIKDLIDGWYGWCNGVNAPACTSDPISHPFVPTGQCKGDRNGIYETCGWATGAPPNAELKPGFNMPEFYQKVPAAYCRMCHIAAPEQFNVQSFAQWFSLNQTIDSQVRRNNQMPLAEATYNNYWSDGSAITLLHQYLDPIHVNTPAQNACLGVCGTQLTTCLAAANDLNGRERIRARASCTRANALCSRNCLTVR